MLAIISINLQKFCSFLLIHSQLGFYFFNVIPRSGLQTVYYGPYSEQAMIVVRQKRSKFVLHEPLLIRLPHQL